MLPRHQTMQTVRDLAVMILLAIVTTGCASYELKGLVVQGANPGVFVVDEKDRRLDQPGLTEVTIDLTIDPRSLGRKPGGMGLTDDQGTFVIPVSEAGAGFLEYEVGVYAARPGFRSVYRLMQLPPGNRRLLIVLSPGSGGERPTDTFLPESINY